MKRLKVEKEIGHGSFGTVYHGTDPVHGHVAVKVLKRDPQKSAEAWKKRRDALQREGRHISEATDAHVVRVFSVVPKRTEPMLVMEFCELGSLQSRFESGPMSLQEVRRVGTHVSLGLQAVHSRGMLHRDIKPANILLDKTGSAKIGDFGLVTDDLVLGYASQQGYWDHLAIEVYQGVGTSIQTDVWALGMTLYRLLHGERWNALHPRPADVISKGGFAKKLTWLPHIPDSWRRFIRKTLHDDKAQRYQNAVDVLNGLAPLPFEPEWQCFVSADKVSWTRAKAGREITVEWLFASKPDEWKAVSRDLVSNRPRVIRSGTGRQSLEGFFEWSV